MPPSAERAFDAVSTVCFPTGRRAFRRKNKARRFVNRASLRFQSDRRSSSGVEQNRDGDDHDRNKETDRYQRRLALPPDSGRVQGVLAIFLAARNASFLPGRGRAASLGVGAERAAAGSGKSTLSAASPLSMRWRNCALVGALDCGTGALLDRSAPIRRRPYDQNPAHVNWDGRS
ncbi:MAG: hypothetical protein H6871_01875 [Methylobacteriaceae bacterium]|nr:hypothetical protein [Methylobacteriaceae bacterium]